MQMKYRLIQQEGYQVVEILDHQIHIVLISVHELDHTVQVNIGNDLKMVS